jgi:hypothetical protein
VSAAHFVIGAIATPVGAVPGRGCPQGPHNETWGGVTFNIDSDRADGPVADN